MNELNRPYYGVSENEDFEDFKDITYGQAVKMTEEDIMRLPSKEAMLVRKCQKIEKERVKPIRLSEWRDIKVDNSVHDDFDDFKETSSSEDENSEREIYRQELIRLSEQSKNRTFPTLEEELENAQNELVQINKEIMKSTSESTSEIISFDDFENVSTDNSIDSSIDESSDLEETLVLPLKQSTLFEIESVKATPYLPPTRKRTATKVSKKKSTKKKNAVKETENENESLLNISLNPKKTSKKASKKRTKKATDSENVSEEKVAKKRTKKSTTKNINSLLDVPLKLSSKCSLCQKSIKHEPLKSLSKGVLFCDYICAKLYSLNIGTVDLDTASYRKAYIQNRLSPDAKKIYTLCSNRLFIELPVKDSFYKTSNDGLPVKTRITLDLPKDDYKQIRKEYVKLLTH